MFDRRKPVGKVVALPADQIEPSPYQARRTFDPEELAGLAASIKEGMDRVPAILRDYQDDQTAALSLLENIQRADLNPFEQARGLQDVLALWGCTQAEPPSGWEWPSPPWPTSCVCFSSPPTSSSSSWKITSPSATPGRCCGCPRTAAARPSSPSAAAG